MGCNISSCRHRGDSLVKSELGRFTAVLNINTLDKMPVILHCSIPIGGLFIVKQTGVICTFQKFYNPHSSQKTDSMKLFTSCDFNKKLYILSPISTYLIIHFNKDTLIHPIHTVFVALTTQLHC